jgi:hypothetical protein
VNATLIQPGDSSSNVKYGPPHLVSEALGIAPHVSDDSVLAAVVRSRAALTISADFGIVLLPAAEADGTAIARPVLPILDP